MSIAGASHPEVSVVLCTHNPQPGCLNETLEALRRQTLPEERWELLLIDNASSAPLSSAANLSWHSQARVIREDRLGLTHARLTGFQHARAGLLIMVDDDNILAPDYLELAAELGAQWPMLGAWGGQCHPRFEQEPPAWTRRFWPILGIREFPGDSWSNVLAPAQPLPIGAGMCVRKEVTALYRRHLEANPKRAGLDRIAGRLMSCGDTDLALTALDMDQGCGLFAKLSLDHIMPPVRLTESYLRDLVHGINYSAVILASYRNLHPPCPSHSERLLKWYESLRLDKWNRRWDRIVRGAKMAAYRDLPKYHPAQVHRAASGAIPR